MSRGVERGDTPGLSALYSTAPWKACHPSANRLGSWSRVPQVSEAGGIAARCSVLSRVPGVRAPPA